MRELSVYYCPVCGHYAYFQLPKNAVCHKCQIQMSLLDMRYQDFMDLDHDARDKLITHKIVEAAPTLVERICAPDKIYNHRELIGRLSMECSRLEKENKELNNTVDWMHKTIWDQLHQIRELERELEQLKTP